MSRYVLKTIHMTLDPDSIQKAIEEVRLFEEKLKPAMQCLIDYLGEKGIEIARAELIFFDDPAYMSGALSSSVKYQNDEGTGHLTAGEGLDTEYGSYAMFVEYGTGFVGANNPEPHAAEEGYEYDVHNHGARGWWYPAPWGTMEADDGTLLAWTNGMSPRPFMHNTMNDLAEEAEASGGRVIAEYIRGERA